MMRALFCAALALALAAACSSSDSTSGSRCDPGAIVFCRCFDDSPGKWECLPSGDGFAACRAQDTGRVCDIPPHAGSGANAGVGGFGAGGDTTGSMSTNAGGSGASGSGGSVPSSCPGEALSVDIGFDETVQGDTSEGADYEWGICGGDGAPEIVYAVTPQSDGTLIATVTGVGATDPVLHARIDDCVFGPEIGCTDATYDGGNEVLTVQARSGKTIYFFVDGYTATQGSFVLNLHLEDGIPGDTCPGNPISIDIGEIITAGGDTAVAESQYKGTGLCSTTGKEIVYRVIPDADGILTVTMDPHFDGLLYARDGTCTSSVSTTQLGCADDAGMGGLEEISFPVVAGTKYSVFADGAGSSSGAFTIQFQLD
jgi:hypothetical protein